MKTDQLITRILNRQKKFRSFVRLRDKSIVHLTPQELKQLRVEALRQGVRVPDLFEQK